ncbi:hypothetical protein AWU68_2219 [Corynebacterium simulans]|nr:hypothetical protein AWU68_2219 [Corynebacterium simulans]
MPTFPHFSEQFHAVVKVNRGFAHVIPPGLLSESSVVDEVTIRPPGEKLCME